ncbi:MAG: FGGY-family carbohydrate kinase [Gammaproteobacteria bacterium]|nr:FGGY-family carbohydrate kinase [Gammaproteobacteria bacterium]
MSFRAHLDCSTVYYLGIDLGTSGVRAVVIDSDQQLVAEAVTGLPLPHNPYPGWFEQEPELWWLAVCNVLLALSKKLDLKRVRALAVDGTSSTLLLSSRKGQPLGPALMYNDIRSIESLKKISSIAPASLPVHSPSSSLAKAIYLKHLHKPDAPGLFMHQADWVSGKLSGKFGISDHNNSLKYGYDSEIDQWPDWVSTCGIPDTWLPEVVAPGSNLGKVTAQVSSITGLSQETHIVAGTTDSTAGVIATGITQPGQAVTSLGSTMVLKIISTKPINKPEYGIYSQPYSDLWLVGGASNSGGAVLAHYFSSDEIKKLTPQVNHERPTGLEYYPLLDCGERFPINNPAMQPKIEPKPKDRLSFFQAFLEGMARIESRGYQLLQDVGAPKVTEVVSIGGGAENEPWRNIRSGQLSIPVHSTLHQQAAFGAALLAKSGMQK